MSSTRAASVDIGNTLLGNQRTSSCNWSFPCIREWGMRGCIAWRGCAWVLHLKNLQLTEAWRDEITGLGFQPRRMPGLPMDHPPSSFKSAHWLPWNIYLLLCMLLHPNMCLIILCFSGSMSMALEVFWLLERFKAWVSCMVVMLLTPWCQSVTLLDFERKGRAGCCLRKKAKVCISSGAQLLKVDLTEEVVRQAQDVQSNKS